MISVIKKIFSIFEQHPDKKRRVKFHEKECPLFSITDKTVYDSMHEIKSFTPVLTPSMMQTCTCRLIRESRSQTCSCCFCQPIRSIIPPSPSHLKNDLKKCERNYLGNQTVDFVKIANKARNQVKK